MQKELFRQFNNVLGINRLAFQEAAPSGDGGSVAKQPPEMKFQPMTPEARAELKEGQIPASRQGDIREAESVRTARAEEQAREEERQAISRDLHALDVIARIKTAPYPAALKPLIHAYRSAGEELQPHLLERQRDYLLVEAERDPNGFSRKYLRKPIIKSGVVTPKDMVAQALIDIVGTDRPSEDHPQLAKLIRQMQERPEPQLRTLQELLAEYQAIKHKPAERERVVRAIAGVIYEEFARSGKDMTAFAEEHNLSSILMGASAMSNDPTALIASAIERELGEKPTGIDLRTAAREAEIQYHSSPSGTVVASAKDEN